MKIIITFLTSIVSILFLIFGYKLKIKKNKNRMVYYLVLISFIISLIKGAYLFNSELNIIQAASYIFLTIFLGYLVSLYYFKSNKGEKNFNELIFLLFIVYNFVDGVILYETTNLKTYKLVIEVITIIITNTYLGIVIKDLFGSSQVKIILLWLCIILGFTFGLTVVYSGLLIPMMISILSGILLHILVKKLNSEYKEIKHESIKKLKKSFR